MKTSVGMAELVSVTETNLKQLGLKFAKNEGQKLVEFDVTGARPFMVRISHLDEVQYPSMVFGNLFPRKQSESNDFRIIQSGHAQSEREQSAALVKGILASLKQPPWKGLSFMESMTAKSMWMRASEARE